MIANNTYSVPELVALLRAGDPNAFQQLYEKFSSKILSTCKKMYLPHEDAEEVVQEVFLKVWEKREGLDSSLSFNAYLFTIMRCSIFKRSRKNAMDVAYKTYQLNNGTGASCYTEEALDFEELKVFSERIIDALPKGQQKIFRLKFTENLTADEIASRLHLSKRTVENQLYKANKKLKQEFISNDLIPYDLVVLFLIF
ncbi:RNA polymerase sigma factor [Cyclobacterium plantarum]|uniref:RNA polymerase sigma factor n=1 Tax=Cyclobacterium plantarum TaxID=2716263 RepID=A0ABX0H971_9BACT|nr:RNA polymerase sigma-70 factor [Cyclobacterium plantarum]NHE57413.1 RNA polymerase sigma-70 factor [Cyclobacterium plantarum]